MVTRCPSRPSEAGGEAVTRLLMGPPPARMLEAHPEAKQPADGGRPEEHGAGANAQKTAEVSQGGGRAEEVLVSQAMPGRGMLGTRGSHGGDPVTGRHPVPGFSVPASPLQDCAAMLSTDAGPCVLREGAQRSRLYLLADERQGGELSSEISA